MPFGDLAQRTFSSPCVGTVLRLLRRHDWVAILHRGANFDFHVMAICGVRVWGICPLLPAICSPLPSLHLGDSSLFFYGVGQPQLLALLALAVFGTYFFLVKAMARRKFWLPAGIAFNLALLAFFKYKLLFVDPSSPSFSDVGAIDLLLKLPLPIGISFFVFHNISLLVDMTKSARPAPSQWDVFLYIIFFPQLVSGPITRAENFLPQIQPKFLNEVALVEAAKWIIVGYFFKLFVANNLNTLTTNMDYPLYHALRSSDRWLCLFLYSYQIYADFFGYSAIAIGLGLLFGYRLPINFNLPYISRSFTEFWTRWHISLSIWLRTYLYIPLGGNRGRQGRTYLNLMIVMASVVFAWCGIELSGMGVNAWPFSSDRTSVPAHDRKTCDDCRPASRVLCCSHAGCFFMRHLPLDFFQAAESRTCDGVYFWYVHRSVGARPGRAFTEAWR